MSNKSLTVGLIAVAIIAVGGYIFPLVGAPSSSDTSLGGSGTRYPNGVSADTTSPSAGQLRGTTLLTTGAASFSTTSASRMLNLGAGSATTTAAVGKLCLGVTTAEGTVLFYYPTSINGGSSGWATTTLQSVCMGS